MATAQGAKNSERLRKNVAGGDKSQTTSKGSAFSGFLAQKAAEAGTLPTGLPPHIQLPGFVPNMVQDLRRNSGMMGPLPSGGATRSIQNGVARNSGTPRAQLFGS